MLIQELKDKIMQISFEKLKIGFASQKVKCIYISYMISLEFIIKKMSMTAFWFVVLK